MNTTDFESAQRAREWFHTLTLLPGAFCVIRVDGRSFSRLTKDRYDKPFDLRFSDAMVTTAKALLTEFGGQYAYTESDEISILLDPTFDLFGRSVEKLVSISAGVASAAFVHAVGELKKKEADQLAHFDSRIWMGTSAADVVDYFSWRQDDAARCALNGWCYWTLRKKGASATLATSLLKGISTAEKNELLFEHGINFNDVPTWQRRGVGLWWETYTKSGYNPLTNELVPTKRRRVHIERELPMKDDYRGFISQLTDEYRKSSSK
jgi:tRNA(His) 5'-end guanylyltransferase